MPGFAGMTQRDRGDTKCVQTHPHKNDINHSGGASPLCKVTLTEPTAKQLPWQLSLHLRALVTGPPGPTAGKEAGDGSNRWGPSPDMGLQDYRVLVSWLQSLLDHGVNQPMGLPSASQRNQQVIFKLIMKLMCDRSLATTAKPKQR